MTNKVSAKRYHGPGLFLRYALPMALACLIMSGESRAAAPAPAFYYWKTAYDPGPASLEMMEELGCGRLYLRLFEVGLNSGGQAVPKALLRLNQRPVLPVAPVVFIETAVFEKAETDPARLAVRVAGLIGAMMEAEGLEDANEWHLDFDWAAGTRGKFFAFCREMKKHLPDGVELAATIRLDQYKNYGLTGVPPVDRVVLMSYNMAPVTNPETANSIIDSAVARQYLANPAGYPLPLDYALPLFAWVAAFDGSEFLGLLRQIPPQLFDSRYCRRQGNIFTVLRPFSVGRWQALPGQRLRLEQSAQPELEAVADLLAISAPGGRQLIFYHLDDALVSARKAHELQNILRRFHQPVDDHAVVRHSGGLRR
ncbi:hypothetical protein C4J81_00835 [Deltaproteobacteria bacterium Smac51]|nr:hypothetical protein C4J81_00835 [Deltaproteobacteria bacterium Smac51]